MSKEQESDIAREYREAAEDEELNAEFKLWDVCMGDGLDETNDYVETKKRFQDSLNYILEKYDELFKRLSNR